MKYFNIDEFACPCCGENLISQKLIDKLNIARGLTGIPFIINSGYRCEVHNKEVGGKHNSSHLLGLAADIKVSGSRERYKILDGLLKTGFTRVGVAKTFIHCDIDMGKDQEVVWTY